MIHGDDWVTGKQATLRKNVINILKNMVENLLKFIPRVFPLKLFQINQKKLEFHLIKELKR